jgi:hypothetical protein
VPLVDRRVELETGVGALPRGARDLAPQFTSLHGLDRTTTVSGFQVPVTVGHDRVHELIGDAHGVIRVLVLDRMDVLAV